MASLRFSFRHSPVKSYIRNFRNSNLYFNKVMKMQASNKVQVLVPIASGSEEIETVTVIDTLVRGGAEVV